jgi:predicted acetylornithine/succinylornithine family transaminase
MPAKNIMEEEDRYLLKTFKKYPVVVVRGKGAYVWDVNDKKYLDFYGGHAVALTGHCHPAVVEAIKEQAERLIFYSNFFYNDVRSELGKMIISVSPRNMSNVFLCNSGTEANETAFKIAVKYTGKKEIVSMKNSFHGRTTTSLGATGIEKYKKGFEPLLSNHKFANFGDIEDLKKVLNEQTAAVIIEPIQSIGGMNLAKAEYYQELAEVCREKNTLLIFDEVQSGFGRTGEMFACQHWKVYPDIITVAKGMASGIPMGGVLVDKRVAETIDYGEHGCTFGGGPIACAASKATIEVIKKENLVSNAKKIGLLVRDELSKFKQVDQVKGLGLLMGMKLNVDVKLTMKSALESGLVFDSSNDPSVARLMPPLIIGKPEVEEFLAKMSRALGSLK